MDRLYSIIVSTAYIFFLQLCFIYFDFITFCNDLQRTEQFPFYEMLSWNAKYPYPLPISFIARRQYSE